MRKWLVVGSIVAVVALGVAYWKFGSTGLTPEELARLPQPVRDRFIRAKERSIEGVGVTPDILLMPALEDVRAGRDPLIERALSEIGKT